VTDLLRNGQCKDRGEDRIEICQQRQCLQKTTAAENGGVWPEVGSRRLHNCKVIPLDIGKRSRQVPIIKFDEFKVLHNQEQNWRLDRHGSALQRASSPAYDTTPSGIYGSSRNIAVEAQMQRAFGGSKPTAKHGRPGCRALCFQFALPDRVAKLLRNMFDKLIISLTQYTVVLLCATTGLAGGKLCERAIKTTGWLLNDACIFIRLKHHRDPQRCHRGGTGTAQPKWKPFLFQPGSIPWMGNRTLGVPSSAVTKLPPLSWRNETSPRDKYRATVSALLAC
jgi:hypothetical protein